MGNLSQGIYDAGVEKGIMQGVEKGRAEERESAAQKIAREYGIPVDKVLAVLAADSKSPNS